MTREFSRKEDEYDIKERLIQTLEKHIKFLEEELRRKDTIITSLIDKQIPKEIEKQKQKQKQNEPSRPGKTPINPPTLQNEQGGVSNENKTKTTSHPTNSTQPDQSKTKPKGLNNSNQKHHGETQERQDRHDRQQQDKQDKTRQEKEKKRVTCVMGDSMIKNIKGWKLNQHLDDDFIVVKSFPGATSEDMSHYIEPSLEKRPQTVVIHTGTNDLKGVETANVIAKRIIKLATRCTDRGSQALVSGLINRGDQPKLNGKLEYVNELLKASCESRNIGFIDNSNITLTNLNNSKLHLNSSGDKKLTNNILEYISKI